jgi:purine-binding chemotaxis protein CheW
MTMLMDESEDRELVLFRSGELLCGIDVARVQEINRNLDITFVHHAPDYVRGVLNLRGQLLTVIDLRRKLGMESAIINPDMRVVVVRRDGSEAGLLVDQIVDIIAAENSNTEPPPANVAGVAGVFFSAVYKMEAALAAVLDLDRVLEK